MRAASSFSQARLHSRSISCNPTSSSFSLKMRSLRFSSSASLLTRRQRCSLTACTSLRRVLRPKGLASTPNQLSSCLYYDISPSSFQYLSRMFSTSPTIWVSRLPQVVSMASSSQRQSMPSLSISMQLTSPSPRSPIETICGTSSPSSEQKDSNDWELVQPLLLRASLAGLSLRLPAYSCIRAVSSALVSFIFVISSSLE